MRNNKFLGCPKKLYLILRLDFGEVNFSIKTMLVLPDSQGTNHLDPKVLVFMS